MLVVVVHSFLFFILLLLFFIHFVLQFVVVAVVVHFIASYVILFFSLLFNVIPHPSVDYRRIFTPILYFQPCSSQSNLRHFHFQPFLDLLFTVLPQALRF